MFGDFVESKEKLRQKVFELEKTLEFTKREYEIKIEEARADIRKEVQQKLIESDLLRNEASAKLEVYEKMDTKADANYIKEALNSIIKVMGVRGENSVHVIK